MKTNAALAVLCCNYNVSVICSVLRYASVVDGTQRISITFFIDNARLSKRN